ncbi:acyltransferase family protein [Aliarcobacter butzleri]|uniref:acyltransferase family protein n=1 Tax=Aliarcobacter butzleri TaxID=28197 RepID=UPI0024DEE804|nr:acyltransferase family protein [Aliarcobacter butzleri]MDK2070744.1 acyltransferase family protein [Aliarcobacter butzleri]
MSNNLKYRPEIDGLRAIAILSVLIFHIDATHLSGGFVGVDIFFVISGFLITGIIKNEIETTGKFSFKNFYIRRVKRLFPALFFTLIVASISTVLLFSPSLLRSFGGALATSLLSVSNFFFWIEADYFDVSSKLKPLLHTWSLSIEEQFYLFWPLALVFLLGIKSKRIVVLSMVILTLLSLWLNLVFQSGEVIASEYFEDGKSTIFFLLPFRVYEFMLGALLVWFIHYELKQKYMYDILFIFGLLTIGCSVVFFDETILFPSLYGLLPVVGTVLLIYSSVHSKFKVVLSNKLFVVIGLISYSLYLVHWPIIVFWNYLDNEITKYDKLYMLLLSFVLAYISYKFVEQPFRKKEVTFKSIKLKLLLFAGFPALVWVGIHMYNHDGWTWRVNNKIDIEDGYNASLFHKEFYGGTGYKKYGLISGNNMSEKNIILVGDSHSLHYAKGIEDVLLEDKSFNFYTSSLNSFLYLPNFTRTTHGKDWDSLTTKDFEKTIGLINEMPNDKNTIVILSHSWVSQLKIAGIKNSENKLIRKDIGIEEIKKGIIEFKNLIGDRQLVVIGQVPTTNKEILYDIFTRPRFFVKMKNIEEYLLMELNEEYKQFNDNIYKYSLDTGIFIFLNPCDVLCKNNLCITTVNNKLIYSDSTHLSFDGSIFVINRLKEKIINILYGEI